MSHDMLIDFINESNRIEGLGHVNALNEAHTYERLLALPALGVEDVVTFVRGLHFQRGPAPELRSKLGMDVRVGDHHPPPGGPLILSTLEDILADANEHLTYQDAYDIHQRYETLHPFMDGNGRSGRAVWLWQMLHIKQFWPEMGFLHQWYYQSLQVPRNDFAAENRRLRAALQHLYDNIVAAQKEGDMRITTQGAVPLWEAAAVLRGEPYDE